MNPTVHLDPRAWLLWLAAATLPLLMGRNPFPILAVFLVVLVIRTAWAPALHHHESWGGLRRLLIFIATISVVFNVLTAPIGDRVLVNLPKWWPLGDVMTLNAAVYGLLAALAISTLVLAGITAGLLLDWPTMLRLLPARFLTLAVAASVAWAFIPQSLRSFGDIREAQSVRGVHVRGMRGVAPFVVPLLATGLDRATTLAEALEARGFGGTVLSDDARKNHHRVRLTPSLTVLTLTLVTTTAYFVISGMGRAALLSGLVAVGSGLIALRFGRPAEDHRTRYRIRHWQRQDSIVVATSALSLVVTIGSQALNRHPLHYEPYPSITVPYVSLPLLFGLALLLAPALVAPAPQAARASAPQPTSVTVEHAGHQPARPIQRPAWWTRRTRPWAAFETRCRGPIPPRFHRPLVIAAEPTKRAA